ncbi:cytochrome c [Microvirga sp. TS319]|uniref:c-type cytochrome n=1 Tax=Microvirga sp. TS319 TaxID=3241165 RepID=UPI00351A2125
MSVPTQSYVGGIGAAKLLGTPVSRLFPGNVPLKSGLQNPVGDDPQAAQRGMQYFQAFNCVGCHAPNGAGGMGPSLSNSVFIYGSEPAQIFLTIYQGRPRGMPTWGVMLPGSAIWDLVAYVRSISREPSRQWGQTVSSQMPQIEQVPAEYVSTATPWDQTEAFSHGQKPNRTK